MDVQPRLYNTLTKQVEPFSPLDPPNVYMYNCGPTVYDYAHIGNFRAFVFADVLRRFLELVGYNVHQVMNITDVGHMTDDQDPDGRGRDKMEEAVNRIQAAIGRGDISADEFDDPTDPFQIARFYTRAFIEDAKKLGIKIAFEYDDDPAKTHMPRATDHVADDMIPMIARLIEKQHAYVAKDGAVYFDVQSFPEYGRLSGNTLDKLRGGAGGRVADANQAAKKHPADFLLWKPDPRHLMKWPSPWGDGYPGWHIECSAMSLQVLSRLAGKELQQIDIHTGGEDNIFPHHECEIAQTRGVTGLPHFAKLWMHTRFLLVEGEKMSKSKGNFYTVPDVLEGKVTGRPVDPAVLRFELLKSHYRSNANFTKKGLEDSASAVQRLRDFTEARFREAEGIGADVDQIASEIEPSHPALRRFVCALADDLNISGAIAVLFDYVNGWHGDDPAFAAAFMRKFDVVLHVTDIPWWDDVAADLAMMDVDATLSKLDAARAAKDFATADRLRKELVDAGYDVQNTPSGTVARKKLA